MFEGKVMIEECNFYAGLMGAIALISGIGMFIQKWLYGLLGN
jgi:hypothetical protein